MNGGLSVGKIYAELEFRDRLTAGLEKAVRQSQAAGRSIGADIAAGASAATTALDRTAAASEAMARRVDTSSDRAARASMDLARATINNANAMGVSFAQLGDNIQRYAVLSTQAQERIARGYTTLDQEHKRFLDQQERGASRTSSALGGIGRMVVAAFAVERVIAFGQHVVETAGKISDLADRTGLGTREIQRFQYAAEQSGGSLEAVAQATGSLNDKLVEGNAGTVAALQSVNLSLEQLRAMRPGEAFETVADAVGRIPDPMVRSQVAIELLGRSGQVLLPAMVAGFKGVGDEAERLGLVIAEQDVKALDDFGDAWSRLQTRVTAATAGMLVDIMRITEGLRDMMAPGPVGQAALDQVRNSQAGLWGPLMGPLAYLPRALNAAANYLDPRVTSSTGGMAPIAPMSSHGLTLPRLMPSHQAQQDRAEIDRTIPRLRAIGKAVAEVAVERYKLSQYEAQGLRQMAASNVGLAEYAGRIEEIVALTDAWAEANRLANQGVIASTNPYSHWANLVAGTAGAPRATSGGLPAATAIGQSFGAAVSAGMADAFKSVPDLLSRAFTNGGGGMGALKGLGVQIADAITRPLFARLQTMTRGVQSAVGIGAAGAGAIGGAFGGTTGAMIGTTAAGVAGAALATTSITTLGAATAATGATVAATTAGMIALGAATLGIGAAAVGIYLLARRFFTVSKEVKQARADVQAFQEELWKTMTPMQVAESAGQSWAATLIVVRDAYTRMGYSAAQAEAITAQLLDTSRPDAARAAMAQINDVVGQYRNILAKANEQMGTLLEQALEAGQRLPDSLLGYLESLRNAGDLTEDNIRLLERLTKAPDVDYKKFEEAAGRYGINRDALGLGFQQSRANTTAQQMVDDVDLLLRGGATMGTILHGMREEISALVQDSLQFGTTLPANMKPWIDELARTGQLVDKNGDALTDLSRLTFAESMETSFQRIADSIQRLVDMLNGPLQSAFTNLPKNVGVGVNVDVNAPGESQTQPYDREGYAVGTMGRHGAWFADFGPGTPTVLHGEQAVVRKDQTGAFVSAFSEGGGRASGAGERPVVLKLRDNRILADVVRTELDGLLALRGVRR